MSWGVAEDLKLVTTDFTPPIITLIGGDGFVGVGRAYNEQGYTATDAVDGDKTSKVYSIIPETPTAGDYTVLYYCFDLAGNISTTSRNLVAGELVFGPIADAGPDQTVESGEAVTLDGSASEPREIGGVISFKWIPPPGVILDDDTAAITTFTAPVGARLKTLNFVLEVTEDGDLMNQDGVNIFVRPVVIATDSADFSARGIRFI